MHCGSADLSAGMHLMRQDKVQHNFVELDNFQCTTI